MPARQGSAPGASGQASCGTDATQFGADSDNRRVNVHAYRPDEDRAWAEAVLEEHIGGALQARRGELHDVLELPGFVAEHEGSAVGILTYRITGDECELAVLLALERAQGIGSALGPALVQAAAGG